MNNLLFQSDRTRERLDLVSRTDFKQPLVVRQRRLLQILDKHFGEKRAITIREITSRTTFNARAVKQLVQELRNAPFFIPICSSRSADGGLFLAASDEERRHFARVMSSQSLSMLRCACNFLEPHEIAAEMAPFIALAQEGVARG